MKILLNRFSCDEQTKHKDNDIFRMLLPSFLGMIVCAACLVGLTFAWFTASVETASQKLIATNWESGVQVENDNKETMTATKPSGAEYVYSLTEGSYTVTVTASGTGSGYCKLQIDDYVCYTAPINGSEFTFNLILTSDAEVTLTTCWGTYSGAPRIDDGGTLDMSEIVTEVPDTEDVTPPEENPEESESASADTEPVEETTAPDTTGNATETTEPDTYIVQEGDTLAVIAAQFGTTLEKLAAYNNISNYNVIKVGQKLRIPPADYEIPAGAQPEADETTAMPQETTKTEPAATQPPVTQPAATEPKETKPAATEAPATSAEATEAAPVPTETESVATEPVETEPVETEPEETTAPEITPEQESEPVEIEG